MIHDGLTYQQIVKNITELEYIVLVFVITVSLLLLPSGVMWTHLDFVGIVGKG